VEETPSGKAFRKGFQEMAEDELFCERPAKMANFRLAFDTRAKKLLDVVDKRPDRDSEAQIFRLDFCAALRHHAANPREW
jgi:hypothetical protein